MKKVLIFCLMIFGMLFPNICAYADYEPIAPSVNATLDQIICPKDSFSNDPEEKRGEPREVNGKIVCCKDGKEYSKSSFTGSYDFINPEHCGCPVNAEKKIASNGKAVCCMGDKVVEWHNVVIYDRELGDICLCPIDPDDGQRGIRQRGPVCCKDGKEYVEGKGYSNFNTQSCCPDGGNPDPKTNVCCKDGHSYVEGSGYIGGVRDCGGNPFCEEGQGLVVGYFKDGIRYDTCCPLHFGGVQGGADSNGQCCERGMATDGQNSTCCDVGEHSEIYKGGIFEGRGGYSKCCKDNEIMGPDGECCVPGTEGCCSNGTSWNGKECVAVCPVNTIYCDEQTGRCEG